MEIGTETARINVPCLGSQTVPALTTAQDAEMELESPVVIPRRAPLQSSTATSNSSKLSVSWRFQGEGFNRFDSFAPACAQTELAHGTTVAICTYRRPESLSRVLESLATQDRRPNELVIVDASADSQSERIVKSLAQVFDLAGRVIYVRVEDELRGLTKQRNLALELASFELIIFFDDDVVLEPQCLRQLEAVALSRSDVVAVGAFVTNDDTEPGMRLRLLRLLGAIPDLVPGAYTRSGMSVPLRILRCQNSLVAVDRVPGCSFLCRTAIARRLRFAEMFAGYALGEDLEFSRRAAKSGRLVICGAARVKHLHDPSGRPNLMRLGRMLVFNRYFVHKTTLTDRSWSDSLWFVYAQTLDYLIMFAGLIKRRRVVDSWRFLYGGVLGCFDILRWGGSDIATEGKSCPPSITD